jgi:DNA-binding NarL/FixJ family response regulator
MDLLPNFRSTPKKFRTAQSWLLSSDVRLSVGFACSNRLMLMGFYNMTLNKQRVAFMVTTEQESLERLATIRPGVLIVSQQLEQGSGLALVEKARSMVSDIRTVLIVNGPPDDLVEAGRSTADAVLFDADCFVDGDPLVSMFRTLAQGQPYRSNSVVAALEAASLGREPWRDGLPDLNRRELEMVNLLVEGLGDREIAERLEVSYETARSRGKVLRRKLGVSSRAQVVAKALQLGLARLGGR